MITDPYYQPPKLPGATNTGERYFRFESEQNRGRAGYYMAFPSGFLPGRTGFGKQEKFKVTPEGRAAGLAYRDSVLAGIEFDRRATSRRRGLLTSEQLDALRTSAGRPVYTRAEPDLPWQECEELVEQDLRDKYPHAFVFVAKSIPGFGSDLGVAFDDGEYWFVEVKKAHTNLTRNEYLRAMEQGESYVIALVNKDRQITYIRNPRDTGKFEEQISVTYKWSAS